MVRCIVVFILIVSVSLLAGTEERGLKHLEMMKKEQRVALVIGTNSYKRLPDLKNPINDARLMRDALQKIGFKVLYSENVTQNQFKKLVKRFSTLLSYGGVGLFYFAGHGIQVDGNNYLIAYDSDISERDEVEFEAIALNYITKKMKGAHNRFNILILDACRSDPFSRSGSGGGLAPVRNARGIFVAYATQAGAAAKDGADKNSVFTKYLTQYMNEPIVIEKVFKKTRRAVYDETNHEQFPAVYNQSMGEFFFTLPKISKKSPIPKYSITDEKKRNTTGAYTSLAMQAKHTHVPSKNHGNYIEPAMIRIKEGSFMMGSDSGYFNERPVHRVTINNDFYMGKYEVTIEEFKKFINDTGYLTDAEKNRYGKKGCYVDKTGNGNFGYKSGASWRDPGFDQNKLSPVVCVSHNDVKAYAKWLSKKTGQSYRLPTEAEWEYAARASTTAEYSFGNSENGMCSYANVADMTAKNKYSDWKIVPCIDGVLYTAKVGSYQPNSWNLYDMHGNVWEWCEDWYAEDYDQTPKDGRANINGEKKKRVLRGGSWGNTALNLRSANRIRANPGVRDFDVGFRLVRDVH